MPPITLLIKPASSLCNMRCQYCFYADVSDHRAVPSYGVMEEDTLEALVRAAFAYAEGSCTFAFQGGEPTLAGLPFFEKALVLQKRHNRRNLRVYNTIQTNGLLLDDNWAVFLARERFLVGLSLDGAAALHNAQRRDAKGKGTHARALRAAELLSRRRCEYNILCVVTKETARHGAQVYGHLRRHRHLQFIPCIEGFDEAPGPLALTAELYGRFLKTTFDLYYHDFMRGEYISVRAFDNYVTMLMGRPPESCAMHGVCTCNVVVEGDGGVYPCDFYVLDQWRLGSIHDDGIDALRTGRRGGLFVEESRRAEAECLSCAYAFLCRGGCRRDRQRPGEETLGLNRFCEAYKAFFAYAIDRLREMAAVAARNGQA